MVSRYLPSPYMIAVILRFESYDILRGRAKVKRSVFYLFRRDEPGFLIISLVALRCQVRVY